MNFPAFFRQKFPVRVPKLLQKFSIQLAILDGIPTVFFSYGWYDDKAREGGNPWKRRLFTPILLF
jgi:hypothetical protein